MPCGLIVFDCHLLVVVVILVGSIVSRPIPIDNDQRELTLSRDKIMKKDRRHSIYDDKNRAVLGELHTYLSHYGYLPRSDLETRAMRTDEEFRSAIRRLQTFATIPVTSKLDKATLDLIRRPRCGLADHEPNRIPRPHIYGNRRRRRYVLHGQKWAKRNLTYKIINYTPDMPQALVGRAIVNALGVWSNKSQLIFPEVVDNETKPDIEFLFTEGNHQDGYQFDGKGSVLAHAFYPEEHLGGDVHYDEDEDWTAFRENEYGLMDLFSVTVHELGHSLGLMHSNIPDAIMFPYYRGYSPDIKLHGDDIAAIRILYSDLPSESSSSSGSHSELIPKQSFDHSTTVLTTTYTIETTTPTTTASTTRIPIVTTIETPITTSSLTTEAFIDGTKLPEETTTRTFSYSPRTRYTTKVPTAQSRLHLTDRSKLDLCDGFYDAITMYKGVLFIFKGQYFWQYDQRGLDPSSPMLNNAFWLGLPETLESIDAAYERADGRLMLFSGRQYWIFDDNKISTESNGSSYPRNITSLGVPAHVDHIDAAFLWSFNRQAYLVSANLYWAFDERWNRVDTHEYPRDMKMWQGIDIPLDDALVDLSGSTYFFKGLDFWRLNDTSMESAMDYPRSINTEWLYCNKPGSSSLLSVSSTFLLSMILLLTFHRSSL